MENKIISVRIEFNIDKLVTEERYYAIKWTKEGIIKLIEDPNNIDLIIKGDLTYALTKIGLINELNPGLIKKVKIF